MGRKGKRRKLQNMAARRRENADCREMLKSIEIPMLKDEDTISFVNNSRVMVIMRGLPGSGKSTIVRLIKYVYSKTVVCSADDYFLTDQGYVFNVSRLKEAHESCQSRASQACKNGASPIVIDNTCVRRWEMTYYVKLAEDHRYVMIVIEPQTPWKNDPAELAKRNKHGVTKDILAQKLLSYECILPYYYAWHLNQKASNKIYHEAERFFHKCLKTIPKFAAELQAALSTNGPGLNYRDTYQVIPTKPLHCTAFFCRRGTRQGKNSEGLPYWEWPAVQRALGRSYGLEVIGFVITPRTVGARIRLSDRQKRLWNKEDDERASPVASVTTGMAGLTMSGPSRGASASVSSQVTAESQCHQFCPTSGFGSRAHFTVGYTKDHSAVKTGLDLLDIISLEQKKLKDDSYHDLCDAKVRMYGSGQAVVYLNDFIRVPALFSATF